MPCSEARRPGPHAPSMVIVTGTSLALDKDYFLFVVLGMLDLLSALECGAVHQRVRVLVLRVLLVRVIVLVLFLVLVLVLVLVTSLSLSVYFSVSPSRLSQSVCLSLSVYVFVCLPACLLVCQSVKLQRAGV